MKKEPKTRTNVSLTKETVETARSLGQGNISAGLRIATKAAATLTPPSSMKTLTLANQKGGVGKSAIASQYAFFLHELGLKTLVVDLDHQANLTKVISKSGLATVAKITSGALLDKNPALAEDAPFILIPSDETLLEKEKHKEKHNAYVNNLSMFLKSVAQKFDVCIIDTNPNPDVRMISALICANYVLTPIELNQEALDGITSLYQLFQGVKDSYNPSIKFLGILPNRVETTPFHRINFQSVYQKAASLMIPLNSSYAKIKNRTAIAEAQAECKPIWKIPKTSARDCWNEIKPVFEALTQKMEMMK